MQVQVPWPLLLVCSAVFHVAGGQNMEWLNQGGRLCSVDELMPERHEAAGQWSSRKIETPLFNCTCPFLKSSYYCPHLDSSGYPVWEPKAVTEGLCDVVDLEQLRESPLPPNSRILFHGNSHLRQPLEGIMCMFKDTLKSRVVTHTDTATRERTDMLVDPDMQCRSCVGLQGTWGRLLEQDNCIVPGSAKVHCYCDDNVGEFEFANGAKVQYYFANDEPNKSVSDALRVRNTKFEDYDIVIGNAGNKPAVTTTALMQSVREVRGAGVPFVWLTTYDGTGDIEELADGERTEFFELGAKFIPVHDMVRDLVNMTKGAVEHEVNNHYCMPGPPNEIGLLFLRIIWAHWVVTHSSYSV